MLIFTLKDEYSFRTYLPKLELPLVKQKNKK